MKYSSPYNYLLTIVLAILSAFIFYLVKLNVQLGLTELRLQEQLANQIKINRILDSLEAASKDTAILITQAPVIDMLPKEDTVHVSKKQDNKKTIPVITQDDTSRSVNNAAVLTDDKCRVTMPFVNRLEPYGIAQYKVGGCIYSVALEISTFMLNLDVKNMVVCAATYDVTGKESYCNSIYSDFYANYSEHFVSSASACKKSVRFGEPIDSVYVNFDNERKTAKYKVFFRGYYKAGKGLNGILIWANGTQAAVNTSPY